MSIQVRFPHIVCLFSALGFQYICDKYHLTILICLLLHYATWNNKKFKGPYCVGAIWTVTRCQYSFTIRQFIGLWFLPYCNRKLHTTVTSPFLSNTGILSSAKNGILDNKIISLTSSKSLWISDQYWKRIYLKTDSSHCVISSQISHIQDIDIFPQMRYLMNTIHFVA